MYWQKRFNRENPDQDLEEKIQKIQEKNKNYGYRRIFGELRKQGLVVNGNQGDRSAGLLSGYTGSIRVPSGTHSQM